jgi:endonuclease YncB( thermonuclease family)
VAKEKKITADWLRKIGTKERLIPGILVIVSAFGITNWQKLKSYVNKEPPIKGIVQEVKDGDTFELKSGERVRLIGVDAPTRESKSSEALIKLVEGKIVWLEYDRYDDDPFGRLLAWVWVNCEGTPEFTPFDYMKLNASASKPGLMTNPKGCEQGKLVQEELLKQKVVVFKAYKDRGELKYQNRLYY